MFHEMDLLFDFPGLKFEQGVWVSVAKAESVGNGRPRHIIYDHDGVTILPDYVFVIIDQDRDQLLEALY